MANTGITPAPILTNEALVTVSVIFVIRIAF